MSEETDLALVKEVSRMGGQVDSLLTQIADFREERTQQGKQLQDEIRRATTDLETRLRGHLSEKVDRGEFTPVRNLVYGFVGFALLALLAALMRPILG